MFNFIDAIVSEVKLNISNSKCEDAVNFIRTRGNIQNMIINNSFMMVWMQISQI